MYIMDPHENIDLSVLDVIHEMYETEREFLNSMRLLNVTTRNEGLLYHVRVQDRVIHVLNRYLSAMERGPERRIVMNIPLTLNGNNAFWDSVNVAPTSQQIERAVERMAVPPADTTCSICQEPMTGGTRIRHCNHFFHGNCINEWFEVNARCPVCRYDIREYQEQSVSPSADI